MLLDYLITVIYGCIVGLSLGLTGGGGSIFAIPLLVYGLGMDMPSAVPVSLIAVAMTAAVGAAYSWRAGLLIWQPIVMFSTGGIIGAPLGILFSGNFQQDSLITGFSILMLAVGMVMWRKTVTRPEESMAVRAFISSDDKQPICKLSADGELRFTTPCAAVLAATGFITGILSGLFGVGGGFLIVPTLMAVIELGVHRAVAASLMIIMLIGIAGSSSAIFTGELQWPVLFPFIVGSLVGMLLGRSVASRIAGPSLQRLFSGVILLTGSGIFISVVLL